MLVLSKLPQVTPNIDISLSELYDHDEPEDDFVPTTSEPKFTEVPPKPKLKP